MRFLLIIHGHLLILYFLMRLINQKLFYSTLFHLCDFVYLLQLIIGGYLTRSNWFDALTFKPNQLHAFIVLLLIELVVSPSTLYIGNLWSKDVFRFHTFNFAAVVSFYIDSFV